MKTESMGAPLHGVCPSDPEGVYLGRATWCGVEVDLWFWATAWDRGSIGYRHGTRGDEYGSMPVRGLQEAEMSQALKATPAFEAFCLKINRQKSVLGEGYVLAEGTVWRKALTAARQTGLITELSLQESADFWAAGVLQWDDPTGASLRSAYAEARSAIASL
jgi:hypothetical protein